MDHEQRIKTLEGRVSALEAAMVSPSAAKPTAKKQSPKEFLLTVTPKTVVDKTLALAYYYEVVTGQGAFNTTDLEAMFRAAKEKLPTNMGDMVNKNIRKGHVMEDAAKKNDKKAWVLTATGEKYAEGNFAEEKHNG